MNPLNKFEKEIFDNTKGLYFPFLIIKGSRKVELNTPKEEIQWFWRLIVCSNYPINEIEFFKHCVESYGVIEAFKWLWSIR